MLSLGFALQRTTLSLAMLPLVLAMQLALPALAPDAQRNMDAPRLERLRVWLAAAEQHQPGRDDPAARRIAAWPRAALEQLRLDLRSVLVLMRRPDTTSFQTEAATGIPLMIVYPRRVLEELGAIAASARGDLNHVLK